ncbi:MAG: T9SS type A sorting domain-containing protein [Bacteroidia bacterium]
MKNLLYTLATIFVLFSIPQIAQAQVQKGQDIDGEAENDLAGISVSMPDANTLAVGAQGNDGGGANTGHARIFKWNGNSWVQKGDDIEGERGISWSGRDVDMPDSNTIAIGAYRNGDNGTGAGHVRVFEWNGKSWDQKGEDLDGEAAGDESGDAISMPDANTIAIGAKFNAGNGTASGHVRIYKWGGTSWVQKGNDIDGEAEIDRSGGSVSMPDSNTVAIGAGGNDANGDGAGHVRIYEWNGKKWTQKGNDIDGEAEGDGSGRSVSMPDVNTVAIGADINGGNGRMAGHVRIYNWNGSKWIQKGQDIDGENSIDRSGYSVSMPDSNTVAIGAEYNDGNGESAGHVRVYEWSGSEWVKTWSDIDGEAAGDNSGTSVSMPDANTVAIGALVNDGNGDKAGHARVFTKYAVNTETIHPIQEIELYPNPTNNYVNIDLQNKVGSARVTISNIQGQFISEEYIDGSMRSTLTLPVKTGWYIISVQPQGGLPLRFKVLKI